MAKEKSKVPCACGASERVAEPLEALREAVMAIEDDETEDDGFWWQSRQKPSRREKSTWMRYSAQKAKVRKDEVKEELLQVKEKVLEVEQPDSSADSEVMEIDAPAAEVQAAQPAQPAPPSSSARSAPAATPGRKMALLQPAPEKPASKRARKLAERQNPTPNF